MPISECILYSVELYYEWKENCYALIPLKAQ